MYLIKVGVASKIRPIHYPVTFKSDILGVSWNDHFRQSVFPRLVIASFHYFIQAFIFCLTVCKMLFDSYICKTCIYSVLLSFKGTIGVITKRLKVAKLKFRFVYFRGLYDNVILIPWRCSQQVELCLVHTNTIYCTHMVYSRNKCHFSEVY